MTIPHGEPPRPAFGRAKAVAPENQPALDFAALRGDAGEEGAPPSRRMIAILIAIMLTLVLGCLYFVHVTLAFKSAIEANITAVYGPYPPFAVVFAVIPAYCGIIYFLLDFIRFKSGVGPFTSPRGIAVSVAGGIFLAALCYLPILLVKHNEISFATGHGYTLCSSLFDPHHIQIYALKTYVDAYGCPSAAPP